MNAPEICASSGKNIYYNHWSNLVKKNKVSIMGGVPDWPIAPQVLLSPVGV